MSSYNDHLASLRTSIVRLVREQTGVHEQIALDVAAKIINVMRQRFRGGRVYFANKERLQADVAMAAFNGRNAAEVCEKHRIPRSTFYRWLKDGQFPGKRT